MGRFPFIITLGGALLGFVAGEMSVSDQSISGFIEARLPVLHSIVPVLCAVLVVALGKLLAEKKPLAAVDLTEDETKSP